jgi:hypothetical protein
VAGGGVRRGAFRSRHSSARATYEAWVREQGPVGRSGHAGGLEGTRAVWWHSFESGWYVLGVTGYEDGEGTRVLLDALVAGLVQVEAKQTAEQAAERMNLTQYEVVAREDYRGRESWAGWVWCRVDEGLLERLVVNLGGSWKTGGPES